VSLEGEPPAVGLRERKKAKTRAAIQRHALRLFKRKGYDETKVEDIAAAAEVSPSTFFRYFPTKEDVVVYDVFDAVLLAKFRAQPPEFGPIKAFRAALRTAFKQFDEEDREDLAEREALFRSVPQLRARMLDELLRAHYEFARVIAERTKRRATDLAVRTVTGAIIGALVTVWLTAREGETDFYGLMDQALAKLETGLVL
jgi:AcrR family transcriptional regulator